MREMSRRDLATFTTVGYDKGRGFLWQAAWFAVLNLVFMKWWCPVKLRVHLLRRFGADLGDGVFIRHRVRVLWPWKLSIGDQSWIGEGAWVLNLEPVSIGSDVCVSQEVLMCTGSHDRFDPGFRYRNAPIQIDDGAWIAARAVVLPGSHIGANATIAAGAIISGTISPYETQR